MSTGLPTTPRCDLLLFLPSLRGGGAERALLSVANGLHDAGRRVVVALTRAEGPNLSDVAPGIEVIDLRCSRVIQSLPGLVTLIRQRQPRCLLSGLRHANSVAVIAARIARATGDRTRVVLTEHTHNAAHQAAGRLWRERISTSVGRLLYPMADVLVAVSHEVSVALQQELGSRAPRVVTIGNPMVTPTLLAQAREAAPHPWFEAGQPPVIVAVGRMVEQKAFDTLLEAFARVRAQRVVRLALVGEGPLAGMLQTRATKLGIGEHVLFPGFQPNPGAWLAHASLFVLSSRAEGLPSVLIEALACGVPVVSTDCRSGPREILEDGRWGPLVTVDDPGALASAILSTLHDPPEPIPLHVLERYSPEHVISQYADVCDIRSIEHMGEAA